MMKPKHCENPRRYGRLFELMRQECQAEATAERVSNSEVRAATPADMEKILRSAQSSLQARV